MDRQRYISDDNKIMPSQLSMSGAYNGLLSSLDYLVETMLVSVADCVISTDGTSVHFIDDLRKNLSSDVVLIKHINCMSGSMPLIVESHTKNILAIPNNICLNFGSISVSTSDEGRITVFGKCTENGLHKIINCKDCVIPALNTFVSSLFGTIDESLTVSLELIDEFGYSFFSEIGQLINHTSRIIEANIWIKMLNGVSYNSYFGIQIEKGRIPSKYVPFRYSTT